MKRKIANPDPEEKHRQKAIEKDQEKDLQEELILEEPLPAEKVTSQEEIEE